MTELELEYLDLAIALRCISEDEDYAESIGWYGTESENACYDRLDELRNQIIKKHPYFKRRVPLAVWALPETKLVLPFAQGKVRIDYDGGWGSPHTTKVVSNPTGLDMYALADEAVRMSGDRHHIFVEILECKEEVNGVKVYSMWCGS